MPPGPNNFLTSKLQMTNAKSTSDVLCDDTPGKMFTKYLELTYYKILNIH